MARTLGDMLLFLLSMTCRRSLTCLQHVSIRRHMVWSVSKFVPGVFVKKLGRNQAIDAEGERGEPSLL